MRCGLCGKRILFFERSINLIMSGDVHQNCADLFAKDSVLFQLKGKRLEE